MTNRDLTSTNDNNFQISIDSCESEFSTMSLNTEIGSYPQIMHSDELPAFEIRDLSPHSRTPSPIDSDDTSSPGSNYTPPRHVRTFFENYKDDAEFIPLQDINALISPPSDCEGNLSKDYRTTRSLETIFEGVFLDTPPKATRRDISRARLTNSADRFGNVEESIIINRMVFTTRNKENVYQGQK